ncbi:SDR family NAD(P)-dependent oxidoreductase, partial [Streptomyces microflavus]|uniref:SDR family NAD(P)-dependent oxidoreductase n=1 Tax=Streptomyces microflavus TaxID=1919 RepID=UPI0034474D7F
TTTTKNITHHPATTPLISTLTGKPTTHQELQNPHYWADQVRHTVRFADAIKTLEAEGVTTYVEIGPDTVLSALAAAGVEKPDAMAAIPLMGRGRPEDSTVAAALGALHGRGVRVDWEAFYAGTAARRVPLPTYAFQHERYWLTPEAPAPVVAEGAGLTRPVWEPVAVPAEGAAVPGMPADTVVHRLVSSPQAPYEALRLAQEWLGEERSPGSTLVVVTDRAVAAGDAPDPDTAAAWGLLASAQAEAPGRIVLVDAPQDTGAEALAAAVATGEPRLAVRPEGVLVPRLRPVRDQGSAARPPWHPEGTVLITGGTGTLGALVARHLVTEHGVRRLLLAGMRGEQAPGAGELREELTALGASVTVAACDVANREQLAELLASVPAEHPLTGVVHTAGVLDNGLVSGMTPKRLAAVLAPKADAARHLDELTRGLGLAAFVLFSSTTGTFGAPGQSNYAAANAFLDALAARRAADGLPATSIAWGLWRTGGINAHLDDRELDRFEQDGFRAVTDAEGLALFDRALAAGRPTLLVGAVAVRASAAAPDTAAAGTAGAPGAGSGAVPLGERLAELSAPEREPYLLALVVREVASVLGHASAASVAPDRPFQDLGFNSLTAVELRNRLTAAAGLPLPATLVFDHPSPAALAAHLHTVAGPAAEDAASVALGELDRLEASLAELPVDDEVRATVSVRLNSLLSALGAATASGQAGADTAELPADASADEIFDFIDNELGRSTA